jgi:hypothetical protein
MVFDIVVASFRHFLSNSGPFIAYFTVKLEEFQFFVSSPWFFWENSFQVAVISKIRADLPFPALFSISTSNFVFYVHDFCNISPPLDFTVLFQIFEYLVLVFSPIFPFHLFFALDNDYNLPQIIRICIVIRALDGPDHYTLLC